MNINRHRGEILAHLNGKDYRLCLTLCSLAELEDAYATNDLLSLAERFSTGRLSSRDMVRIIAAGLRGGGEDIDDESVSRMQGEGAVGYARIVSELLIATFGSATEPKENKNP